MKKFLSLTTILAVVAALSITLAVMAAPGVGCISPEQALETGILRLYLSDAPTDAENVTGVYITINATQYHRDGQWITCEDFVGPQTYDLLELTGGNSTLLGELTLPAGYYAQIRFML